MSAAKTGRIGKLLITFVALAVVLLIGRLATMPDRDKNYTAAPEATSETQSGSQDEDGGTKGGPPAGNPTAGRDNKTQDDPSTTDAAPPIGQAPPDKSPPATTAAAST
ncbi:hypothetical protein ABZ958_37815 [Streptomyces sp. NPDC046237]|uniref:hypothetical protein n=1 Tax=Streptomyces sp. NPDC046237 TaxID=3154914 RepID=UPI0033D37267